MQSDAFAVPRRKILLLEDDVAYQAVIKEFLETDFYDVVAVGNGAEGLMKIKNEDFDAVICDLMMPTVPGDMFYIATRRLRPALCNRFIFITGHRADPKIRLFLQEVRSRVLWKPFHMHDLKEAIESVILDPDGTGARKLDQNRLEALLIGIGRELRGTVTRSLEQDFYTASVQTEEEGYRVLKGRDFDVVVCDLGALVEGVKRFLETLVHWKPSLRNHVLFVSSTEVDAEVEDCVVAAGCELLTAPLERVSLASSLKRLATKRFAVQPREKETYEVLLIEDDVILLEIMSEYFSSLGWNVRIALNGETGWDAIKSARYDAIVSDIMMPGLSGEELYTVVQESMPEMCARFVFITGHQNDPEVAAFLERTGCPMLPKPFKMSQLKHSVMEVG